MIRRPIRSGRRTDVGSGHETPLDFVPRRSLVAEFAAAGAAGGTTKMREAGYKNLDTHTPFPIHGIEEALGLEAPEDPAHRPVRRDRRRLHRLLADLLLQRVRLAAQHRQPAAPRAPGEHPDHVRAGRAAGRRVGVPRVLRAREAAASPITRLRVGGLQPRSIDAFFLSIELRSGTDATARIADIRAAGAMSAEIVEESER
jgi:hypothetical protein